MHNADRTARLPLSQDPRPPARGVYSRGGNLGAWRHRHESRRPVFPCDDERVLTALPDAQSALAEIWEGHRSPYIVIKHAGPVES